MRPGGSLDRLGCDSVPWGGRYHLLEADTGRALSLTMWETDDALAAAERAMRAGQAPADGRISRQSSPTVRVVNVEAVF